MSESEYWKRFMAKRLSRRSIIRGGAVMGAGLALGSTIGCGSDQSATPTAASGTKPGATTAAGAAPTKGPKTGGTLNLAHNQDPPTLDTYVNVSYATVGFVSPVYNRLLKYKTGPEADPASFDLMPDLAESWEIPDDNTYLFKLRQGVKFHNKPPLNGRELTSEDVKYALERLGTNKPEYHAKYMVGEIDKIDTPDKYTVKITMKSPFAPFLNYMASHYPWIMPKELGDKPGELDKTAIGTGPFMLDSYERNVKAVFKKNPDYFIKGRPYVDQMIYNIMPDLANRVAAFRTKQLDEEGQEIGLDLQQTDDIMKSTSDALKEEIFSRAMVQVGIQNGKKPFNDIKVRQAMSMALDRKASIDTLLFGKGKPTGNLPPSVLGWGLEADQLGPYYQRDVEKAKKLLAEAGYPNGFKVELLQTAGYGPTIVNAGVMVKDQLKDIGIDVEIKQMEYAAYLKEINTGAFKDIYVGYQTPFIEVDEFLYGVFHSKGGRNYVKLQDSKLDEMLVKQRQSVKEPDRKKLVVDIQKYLNEQLYTIGIYVPSAFVVWYPYFKGFRPHSFGSYAMHMWQDVWLDK